MSDIWTDVDANDEERVFRESIRRYVLDVVNPLAERARKEYDEVTRTLNRESAKRGILGLGLPVDVGGQGANSVYVGICKEEIGRGRVFGYGGAGAPLFEMYADFAKAAGRELVKKWMPKIMGGEVSIGIGATEPRTGSDIATITTSATKKGDKWIINGEKGPISGVSRSDAWLILVRTSESAGNPARGITQFFVERDLSGIEIYKFNAMEESADLGGIRLQNVEVPDDHIVGEVGNGFAQGMHAFEVERALNPTASLGAAMESIEIAVEYTKGRMVWGRPIASFEGVMFPIVESITKLNTVRAFLYTVLRLYANGKKISKESSMLRWYVARNSLDALDVCIQVSGAAGYTDAFPHEKRYRWIRAGLFGHGTQEIQKLVTGREIFGREIYDMALGRTPRVSPPKNQS